MCPEGSVACWPCIPHPRGHVFYVLLFCEGEVVTGNEHLLQLVSLASDEFPHVWHLTLSFGILSPGGSWKRKGHIPKGSFGPWCLSSCRVLPQMCSCSWDSRQELSYIILSHGKFINHGPSKAIENTRYVVWGRSGVRRDLGSGLFPSAIVWLLCWPGL